MAAVLNEEFDKDLKFYLTKQSCKYSPPGTAKYKINNLLLLLFYDARFKESVSFKLVVIERAESSK